MDGVPLGLQARRDLIEARADEAGRLDTLVEVEWRWCGGGPLIQCPATSPRAGHQHRLIIGGRHVHIHMTPWHVALIVANDDDGSAADIGQE